MYRAIIFDWAGVIAEESFEHWLKANVPNLEAHYKQILSWGDLVDRGDMPEDELNQHLAKLAGSSAAKVRNELISGFQVRSSMLDLISKLKAKYKIGLLSNFIYEWLHEMLLRHNLYACFDAVVISSKERLIKPEPAIYELVLKRLGVEAAKAVFIDDREPNVKGAIACGLAAIRFGSQNQVERDLAQMGVDL